MRSHKEERSKEHGFTITTTNNHGHSEYTYSTVIDPEAGSNNSFGNTNSFKAWRTSFTSSAKLVSNIKTGVKASVGLYTVSIQSGLYTCLPCLVDTLRFFVKGQLISEDKNSHLT